MTLICTPLRVYSAALALDRGVRVGPLSQLANAGTGTGEMASDEDKGLSEGYDEGRLIEQALAVARRVRDVPPSFEPGALPESDPTARSVDSDHPDTADNTASDNTAPDTISRDDIARGDIRPDDRPDLQLTDDSGADSIRRRPLGATGLEEDVSDPVDLSGFELTIEDFGSAWSETVRGWVVDAHGNTVWRPIVTTTDEVPNWTIESTLGVVRGESAIGLDLSSIRRLLPGRESRSRAKDPPGSVGRRAGHGRRGGGPGSARSCRRDEWAHAHRNHSHDHLHRHRGDPGAPRPRLTRPF